MIAMLLMGGHLSVGDLITASFCLFWFDVVFLGARLGRFPRRSVRVLIVAGLFFAGATRGIWMIRAGQTYAIAPTLFSVAMGIGFLVVARRFR
jgi:hypothetical protein